MVLDLDRLGRLAGELVAPIDALKERGVAFRALNSPMDTTTPAGRAFLQIQAAFGPDGARRDPPEGEGGAARRPGPGEEGRPAPGDDARQAAQARHLMADRERSIPSICAELGGLPTSTLYHYLHADGALKRPGRDVLGEGTKEDAAAEAVAPVGDRHEN